MDNNLRQRRIGARLRTLRGDLKQSFVAGKIGVSAAAVSMYENGKRNPRDEIKMKLANLFGKRVEEIFYWD